MSLPFSFLRTIFSRRLSKIRGSALVFVLVVTTIATIIFSGVISYVVSHLKYGLFVASREQSLQVAEAGAHFYRWYIAHQLDGKNTEQINEFWQSTSPSPLGVGSDYEDDFQGLGKYRITVTPPVANSTLFTLESTGWTYQYPSHTRTIRVRFRRPSWSEYMILGNDPFRLSSSTEIFGPMHGNGGIRFDGVAHNVVSAGVTCYDDPDTSTVNSCERPGVWTGDWPGTEYNTTLGNSVFLGGKNFPVTTIDFNSVTADLSYMKDIAKNSGSAAHYYGPSGQYGYLVTFKPTGYDITEVKTINSSRNTITKLDNSTKISKDFPSKGLIFVEDTVWFDGKGVSGVEVDAERMTLAVTDLEFGTDPNLYIIDGAVYKNGSGGQEALGFIAEGSIDFPYDSANNLEINGALLAQKGAVQRANYGNIKNKITIFGAIASKGRIGFGYTDGTGYQDRELHFDENLSISPPPYFPTGKQYLIDLWEEL
ncbi:MAG: hypothetical protein IPJ67_03385 [Candidatus Moraniibacteriota bacterium]|nr:MAG: hypothetical protein IPJ67_03385 [Candidatus Moranbacteria bacterium]